MAQSFAPVSQATAVEDFTQATFAPPGPRHYSIERVGGRVWHHEQMLVSPAPGLPAAEPTEVIYDQAVEVDYTVGSGTRGRSYLIERDGQFFASSINWYAGAGRWDLAPGYAPENHLRFERLVPEDCLFCHAGRTSPAQPAAARYADPPFREMAIGCERCHGPGRRHIEEQVAGANGPELSIVNPAKLDQARRDSVCNQCHLHGEARIPRHGKSVADFRAGSRLDEVLCVLVQPTPPHQEGALRAVSQVEQMQSSACSIESGRSLGCISCHDPHAVPSPAARHDFFRKKCLACHGERGCALPESERQASPANDSCIDCHMPRAAAGGIPHAAQTDHRILKRPIAGGPPVERELATLIFFDGSDQFIPRWEQARARAIALLELGSRRNDRVTIAARAEQLLQQALKQAPEDVETLHHLGTACLRQSRQRDALRFWDRVLELEPDRIETLFTHAVLCAAIGETQKSASSFERLIILSPWQPEFHGHYAELLAATCDWKPAIVAAERAIEIDPTWITYRQLLAEAYGHVGREDDRRIQIEILKKMEAAR